jgi:hypothetical protein
MASYMTQEIIEMAKPRAWHGKVEGWTFNSYEELEAFAKQVTEKEREACAKIADEWAVGWPHPSQVIAERIRARS